MLSLLDESIGDILSFCDIIDITCFGLINKRYNTLCMNFNNKIAPGCLIKIKDKCRSPLFPSFPVSNQQALRYLPFGQAKEGLNTDLKFYGISDTSERGSKCIYWESIPITELNNMLRYRSLDEILLFEERHLPQLLTNKAPEFLEPRANPITREEFYEKVLCAFSNKRMDVLDYFRQMIPIKSYHFPAMQNPLFIADAISKSKNREYDRYLENLICQCSMKHKGLLKEQLLLSLNSPTSGSSYGFSITFTRQNLPLLKMVLSLGYKINFGHREIRYDDKNSCYRKLNDAFLEDLSSFIAKNYGVMPNKLANFMLGHYLKRFGLEGCLKYRARFGDSQNGFKDTNIITYVITFYQRSITVADMEWFALNGFALPAILPLGVLSEYLIPVFTWLYNNGVGINGGCYYFDNPILKKFLRIINYRISNRQLFEFLITKHEELTPEICKTRIDLLTEHGYAINDNIINLLIKSNVKLPQRKMFLSQIISSAKLTVTNKEVLEIITNNTCSQCKLLADSHPGILEYYYKMFYPGFPCQ